MIRISNITKSFGDNLLFKNLSFEFNENSRIVIQGKSGSGKTTLLKILCGLESADHGTVEKDEKCKLSYVFQQDCLFDHLTALQNIVFGISETISKEELWNRVKRISIDTCCQEFLNQKTSTLSGGQRQRVSLARALIQFPDVVLMDDTDIPAFSLTTDDVNRIKNIQETGLNFIAKTYNYSMKQNYSYLVLVPESSVADASIRVYATSSDITQGTVLKKEIMLKPFIHLIKFTFKGTTLSINVDGEITAVGISTEYVSTDVVLYRKDNLTSLYDNFIVLGA